MHCQWELYEYYKFRSEGSVLLVIYFFEGSFKFLANGNGWFRESLYNIFPVTHPRPSTSAFPHQNDVDVTTQKPTLKHRYFPELKEQIGSHSWRTYSGCREGILTSICIY